MSDESFWTVKKIDECSSVQRHTTNPVTTSYELLWAEIRSEKKSKLTIQNTMRRIIENYFKILGGVDPDDICAKFEGREKLICKSLFSWVNYGSHFAHDDLFVAIDDGIIESYLKVFRKIFKQTDQMGHYKMMMGDAFVEEPARAPVAIVS